MLLLVMLVVVCITTLVHQYDAVMVIPIYELINWLLWIVLWLSYIVVGVLIVFSLLFQGLAMKSGAGSGKICQNPW